MFGIFLDALVDSLKMVPLLLVIYIGIELVEYKFGEKIREKVQRAGKAGPLIGAAAGSLPQCGFSVVATVLYTERLATIGTLLAVYLATSDEAIPVILAQPGRAAIIIPLILTKVVIALLVGYFADLVYKKSNAKTLSHIRAYARGEDAAAHHHEEAVVRQEACCGHKTEADAPKFDAKEIILMNFLFLVCAERFFTALDKDNPEEIITLKFLAKIIFSFRGTLWKRSKKFAPVFLSFSSSLSIIEVTKKPSLRNCWARLFSS